MSFLAFLLGMAALTFFDQWRRAVMREGRALAYEEAAQREIERLRASVDAMHQMVDQTDPDDRIGVALTAAGLTAHGEQVEPECICVDVPIRHLDDNGHLPQCHHRAK